MQRGIPASPGIAIGKVFIFKKDKYVVNKEKSLLENVAVEIQRFYDALDKSKIQLTHLKERIVKKLGEEKGKIIEAQLMILDDTVFIDETTEIIEKECLYADYAVTKTIDRYIAMFNDIDDAYLKERATDIKDVGERLIFNIYNMEIKSINDIVDDKVIIVANDLTPSDTAQIDEEKVIAIATDMGGRTSHTAIMARSLGIPAVVGLKDLREKVKDNDCIIVDGSDGEVIIEPGFDTIARYIIKKDEYEELIEEMKGLKSLPAETKDRKRRIELYANIGSAEDCKSAISNGAEGVGLFRTEFLYMNRNDYPNEEEQFLAYKRVAEMMSPHSVIIRTLDIGGDKNVPYMNMPSELNPFLGWRAIRMCLDRKSVFKTQLRGILRASVYGNVKIMYPMIIDADEVKKANLILNEAKKELKEEQIPFNEKIEVGIMIETPAAATIADVLIKEVDFFSIGTNDLIQYTLAVDRMNENISHLYNPLHPAILRLIKNVIDESHKANKYTGMCGEMAGDPKLAILLLGLGLDEFSMSANSILHVKKAIRSIDYSTARKIAEQALRMGNSNDIRELLQQLI